MKWQDMKEGDKVVYVEAINPSSYIYLAGKEYTVELDGEALGPRDELGRIPDGDWGFVFDEVTA